MKPGGAVTGAEVAGAAVVVPTDAGTAVEETLGAVPAVVLPDAGAAVVPLDGTAAAGRSDEEPPPQADTAMGANNGTTVHQ